MVVHALEGNSRRSLHLLGADFLFKDPMRELMAQLNVHPANFESANELLQAGHIVGVWPEGVNGVGKTIEHRYQLQEFGRAGFARLAALNDVPIIPTAVIGSEEAYPLMARVEGLLDWAEIPYLPVTPTFPALGLWGSFRFQADGLFHLVLQLHHLHLEVHLMHLPAQITFEVNSPKRFGNYSHNVQVFFEPRARRPSV